MMCLRIVCKCFLLVTRPLTLTLTKANPPLATLENLFDDLKEPDVACLGTVLLRVDII